MLTSIKLDNFRGFNHLRIAQLARINLVSGKNNTGKTAVLEAIYLLLGPLQPQLATSFAHRGEGRLGISMLPFGLRYSNEWQALFFNRAVVHPIQLSCDLTDKSHQSLTIQLREAQVQLIEPGAPKLRAEASEDGPPTTQEPVLELVYAFTTGDGIRFQTVATPSQLGGTLPRERLRIIRDSSRKPSLPRATFLGTDRQPRRTVAERFSDLRDTNRHGPIEAILRELEPRLRSIEIRAESGRAELAGDVGLSHLVPLRMMGEGITRLTEILLAVFSAPRGIVLVDEIENGLHYSVLPKVWDAIIKGAREAEVQLIATTHSYECISAAHHAAAGNAPYELQVHRLDRINNGISATVYDRRTIEASFAMGLETR